MCPDLRRPPCGCVCALQDILFYQLPEHPQFYSELLNLLEEDDSGETATGTAGRQWGSSVHPLLRSDAVPRCQPALAAYDHPPSPPPALPPPLPQ